MVPGQPHSPHQPCCCTLHPSERLPHIPGPPSVLSLALSAGMWEIFRCSPLPVSDYNKLDSFVRPSLFVHSCPHFNSSSLTTQWGVPGTLWLVFPAHSVWRKDPPSLWSTHSLTPLPFTRQKIPSQRYPIPHPTLFTPFCSANILNLQVK